MNQHGQALVESTGMMLVAVGLFLWLMQPTAFWVSRLWLEFSLNQNLRCQLQVSGAAKMSAVSAAKRQCHKKTLANIALIPWGRIIQLDTNTHLNTRKMKTVQSKLIWCFETKGHICNKHKKISLSMQYRESRLAALPWLAPLPSRLF